MEINGFGLILRGKGLLMTILYKTLEEGEIKRQICKKATYANMKREAGIEQHGNSNGAAAAAAADHNDANKDK